MSPMSLSQESTGVYPQPEPRTILSEPTTRWVIGTCKCGQPIYADDVGMIYCEEDEF